MEFFEKGKAVRLRSHLNKYLIADDDRETVQQSRNLSSSNARWTVEFVEGKSNVLRLKSCHGRYLTASDVPFLLGMTGKCVTQSLPSSKWDSSLEWEPERDGFQVKLKSWESKFLRANGGPPPWRNSITHDVPQSTKTQYWVSWHVEVLDNFEFDEPTFDYQSEKSSLSSVSDELVRSGLNSPLSTASSKASNFSFSNSVNSSKFSFPKSPNSPLTASESEKNNSHHESFANQLRQRKILFILAIKEKKDTPSIRNQEMEFFEKGKNFRLRSHLDKYLFADDDGETIRQSRNSSSSKARWTVEFVKGKTHVLRLKNCHGRYLTASDMPFLLDTTGKRVTQSLFSSKEDSWVEWEPQKEGIQVKLRSSEGTFMRANGGPPPWRNSITHHVPHCTTTQDWVLWYVEVVDNPEDDESAFDYQSEISSLSSMTEYQLVGSEPNSQLSRASNKSSKFSFSSLVKSSKFSLPESPKNSLMASESEKDNFYHESFASQSAMEIFHNAKTVRLRSHHEKYLLAEEDEESVCQERNGSSKRARWNVEFVQGANVIRLKSSYGKYLTASNVPFLLGMTGRKVLQTMPRRLDSSVEWEPIKERSQIRLKTRYGNYLRANGGLPPWRNSITHDIPHRTATQDWVVWDVDIIEIKVDSPPRPSPVATRQDSEPTSPRLSKLDSIDDSYVCSPPKPDGRTIYYNIADYNGDVQDGIEGPNLIFKGSSVDELTQKLEEETGLEGITVCSRNIVNGKLYPLRLHLPPNNTTMHVVVVPATSKAARDFARSANPTIT